MSVTSSDNVALRQPQLNISNSGVLPKYPTTWSLSLPCSGLKTARVFINLDVSIGKKDHFVIKREKDCEASAGSGENGVSFAEMDSRFDMLT